MTAIRIKVNGERREVSRAMSVDDLLKELSLPEKRIAVELNGRVIGRSDWAKALVGEEDKIEVVHFVGGG